MQAMEESSAEARRFRATRLPIAFALNGERRPVAKAPLLN
jgi:hypothetical protein